MSCHSGPGSCGSHSHQTSRGCDSGPGHQCGQGDSLEKTTGYFLHQIKGEIEDGFEALHEEIEELQDKVERLEKALGKR